MPVAPCPAARATPGLTNHAFNAVAARGITNEKAANVGRWSRAHTRSRSYFSAAPEKTEWLAKKDEIEAALEEREKRKRERPKISRGLSLSVRERCRVPAENDEDDVSLSLSMLS